MPGVVIGNNCIIGQNVFIGPSEVFTNVANPRSFIERKNEFRPTLVQQGATIGEYALIGAGAVLPKMFRLMQW